MPCAYDRYQRYSENDSHCGSDPLYDLDPDGIHVDDLKTGIIIRVHKYQRINGTSGKGKDQRIGHGPHHIFSHMDPGNKKFLSAQIRISKMDLIDR